MIQQLTIDLRRPPRDRWCLTESQKAQARELLRLYKADLGMHGDVAEFLTLAAKELVDSEHWSEMEALASVLNVPVGDFALCNFYYDAIKVVLGCTAFAVETDVGILHARNLDWWTENAALARYTCVCHFKGAAAGPFSTVGWPGFIGAFSGIAHGRFSVSLNAVLSFEPAQPAIPVVLLLRTVLEKARSYSEALDVLCNSVIPCDCLLLLTGAHSGELVVVERTPTRYALHYPESGFICVTMTTRSSVQIPMLLLRRS